MKRFFGRHMAEEFKVASVVAAVTLAVQPSLAHAQSAVDGAIRQAEQIDRFQSQQERLREDELLRQTRQAPSGEGAVAPLAASSSSGEACIEVNRIAVSGVSLIPASRISQTLSRWEGRCLGLAELNSALEAITFLYVDRGYVSSRAYLPEQDLADGSLDILVIEGKLETIALNGRQPADPQIATAFPGLPGKTVNLRDIEQGLDQINRLRSNKATIALAAGRAQGGSVLDVKVEKTRPWHFSMSSDNLGSLSTGRYQTRADFGADNILGLNDEWQIGYQRSMERHPLRFGAARPNGNSLTGSVSIPYGYWTFGLNASWSDYRSSITGLVSQIETSGGSLSFAPFVTRILHRDQISKTWLTGRLTWKENENFVLGSKVDVSSRVLSVATLELGHSRQLLGGQASGSLGYHRGLKMLGAFDDSSAAEGSPKGQFEKLSASLGYQRAFDLGATAMIFSSNLSGQWSPDDVFGSEQISAGGYSTVRGVREAVLYADTGIVMRNELSLLLPGFGDGRAVEVLGRLEPYAAIDLGHTVSDASGNSLGGNLVGAAVGLRNRGGRINFDVSYSDILSMPDLPSGSVPSSGLVQARMSISF
ncbi:hemolysin activation/secretion protein [Rhizobium sp. RU33A]|uniref:ShlB/FhaC/HecB family hemolysin secretion/activation protein n=1 Tax=Rhizobium sp. RU33A TaxID=1907413 RepID=UPI0009540F9B|nr:ShlB/FhaC/HecB family hemolysin secretion/activation protein [Rhizobium sp. RU33A]SIR11845.1 hemolysin activation/secretion protein [Rhizobium sp. RU33A]